MFFSLSQWANNQTFGGIIDMYLVPEKSLNVYLSHGPLAE